MAKNRTNRNIDNEDYDVDVGHPGRASENYGKKSGSDSDSSSKKETEDGRKDNPGKPKGS